MGVTRRYWGEVGLVVVLAGLTLLFQNPLLLVATTGVGGWLVVRQYAFVRAVSRTASELSVTRTPDRSQVTVGEEVEVVLGVRLPRATPVRLEVDAEPPVGVEVDGPTRAVLAVGDAEVTETFGVACPLAGEFAFGRPTVTATDPTGRFRTTFAPPVETTITVDPRRPKRVRVGVRGQGVARPYGDHPSGERGPGFALADIRTYVPGDAVRHIDWNATARLGEAHVREFETETEYKTSIVLDCRSSMATGPVGETKFDYARQVALEFVSVARERGDPLGVYAVGEEGLLVRRSPRAGKDWYATIEHRLRELEPQESATEDERTRTPTYSPPAARRRARQLRSDESSFATRLRPFFASANPYVERIESDALYATARAHLGGSVGRTRAPLVSVVLTDDENRAETREAVKVARRHDGRVLVFLTPTVLFEPVGMADADAAYERYADFEEFRSELARIDRVSAFEVGPGYRLDSLLASETTRRTRPMGE